MKSKGIKIIERKIKPSEMKNFDGCFLTGTAAEVTPVSQIEDNQFLIPPPRYRHQLQSW